MPENQECVVVSEQLLENGTVKYHQTGELDCFDFEVGVVQANRGDQFVLLDRPDGGGVSIDVRMLKGMLPRLIQLASAGVVPDEGLKRPTCAGHWWWLMDWLTAPQYLRIEQWELNRYREAEVYANHRWWPFKPVNWKRKTEDAQLNPADGTAS